MGVIVETQSGRIEGAAGEGHQRFLGIPYARPPLGALRFRAPLPPQPWSDVLRTEAFGLSAPQNRSPLPGMESGPHGEDCLTLNVYTRQAGSGRRPVMVWIHGGGFTSGSGAQALYEGGPLVRRGDVVLVTINYRLGAFGYLDLPGADTNVGQRDQIAALEWVRDNVAAFGGDPDNVTIFGESAGGMAVATLLAMPGARGLFRRAIAQSGAAHHTHDRESAGAVSAALLAALDLPGADADALRELSVERLLEGQAKAQARSGAGAGLPFAPVVDGESLPRHPLEAVRDGEAKGVTLMVGTTRDESKLFNIANPALRNLDEGGLVRAVRAFLRGYSSDPRDARALVEKYRKAREGVSSNEPSELVSAIQTDRTFRIPAIRLAEAHARHQPAAFKYLFSWASPARRGALGACHAIELPFVFGTLAAPTMDRFAGSGPEADGLCERVMDAWIAFACTGDPGHAAIPDWPAYDEQRRATLVFDRETALQHAPFDAERAAWDGIL